MIEQSQLIADIHALGVQAGDSILMHASYKSVGTVNGGIDAIIAAFREALGESGTLCMPSLSYNNVDWNNPFIDLRQTPSCIGYLPEYFRQQPGVMRSIHLTHSVSAIGANAEEICGEHQKDTTPCGAHSPFARLRDLGGKILMLGCGLGPNTSMHGVEETVNAPYLFIDGLYAYEVINGDKRLQLSTKRHDVFDQHYEKIAEHLSPEELHSGNIGEAQAHLIDAKALWEKAAYCMLQDPYYFSKRRD